ncbi:hypothetical protein F4803DRAFT_545940 [Xylaria telfairii]|nr:hypothetical protein F4803DRAFT_545940 [Xylaria telfairii]
MEDERPTTPMPAAHNANEINEANEIHETNEIHEAIPAIHEIISQPESTSTTAETAIAQLPGITTMADSATDPPQINICEHADTPNCADTGTRTTGSSRSTTTDYHYSHRVYANLDTDIHADVDTSAVSHLYADYSPSDPCGDHVRNSGSSPSPGPGSNGSANANADCCTSASDDKQPYRFITSSPCANTFW